MNTSSLRIYYETGCIDEVHMPDPSYESGVALQREYLDISNPDNGIFLDRSYKMPGGDNDEYRELCDRMLVVSPDDLARALLVESHGLALLTRDPLSDFECGLSITLPDRLGFSDDACLMNEDWYFGNIQKLIEKVIAMGPATHAALVNGLAAGVEGLTVEEGWGNVTR